VHVQNGSVRPTAHLAIVKAISADFSKQREAVRRSAEGDGRLVGDGAR